MKRCNDGFMGMGMAMNAGGGGMNPQNLFAMGQQQEEARRQEEAQKKAQEEEIRRQVEERLRAEAAQQQAAAATAPVTTPEADTWTCSCGNVVSGKFCPECGSKKPEPKPVEGWKCACGNIATGNSVRNAEHRSRQKKNQQNRKDGPVLAELSIRANSV